MDLDNNLIVSKSRCEALSGAVIPKPGEEVADILKAWLTDGVPVQDAPQPQPARVANSTSKGGDENKRDDYHAAILAYLTEVHGVTAAEYPAFIAHAIGGDVRSCDINRLAEIARYAYGAARQGSK